ncbi:MAG TPA: cation:proton antiporter [Pyrinomonadaceae bacterium]|jgi:Kef-type K+ transport system membrane component KefB|nr:cation:proton antiporter [Pyrinomonadaceae bacterium]
MNRKTLSILLLLAALTLAAQTIYASAAGGEQAGGAAHGLNPLVLIGVALILLIAKLGGELFERFGQPAVLGELIGGMIVGNLVLFGVTAVEPLKTDVVINALAEIGVILLLFEVGLESNLGEMLEVGWSSLLVALLGVVAPFFLGWSVASLFIPNEARLGHIFIGATLCATSVGITARVLKDMGKLNTRVARIVLGAAVIDDVLGLIILAVVQGAIQATAAGTTLSSANVAVITLKAVGFLFGALIVGRFLVPHIFRGAGKLEGRGVLLALAVAICFVLSWAAAGIGLAAIVGAFAAGLLLEEAHIERMPGRTKHDLHELLTPLTTILVPIFFVLMGLKVDLRAFGRLDVLGFATALTAVAIIGKLVCSLGVIDRGVNRLAVGLGMIPRGEVGLIFAGIGATLMLPNAAGASEPVINSATFAAVVIMVIVTTLITPPLLKWSLARHASAPDNEPLPESERETADEAAERTSR